MEDMSRGLHKNNLALNVTQIIWHNSEYKFDLNDVKMQF